MRRGENPEPLASENGPLVTNSQLLHTNLQLFHFIRASEGTLVDLSFSHNAIQVVYSCPLGCLFWFIHFKMQRIRLPVSRWKTSWHLVCQSSIDTKAAWPRPHVTKVSRGQFLQILYPYQKHRQVYDRRLTCLTKCGFFKFIKCILQYSLIKCVLHSESFIFFFL
jgi:hypothetical protein